MSIEQIFGFTQLCVCVCFFFFSCTWPKGWLNDSSFGKEVASLPAGTRTLVRLEARPRPVGSFFATGIILYVCSPVTYVLSPTPGLLKGRAYRSKFCRFLPLFFFGLQINIFFLEFL